MKFLTGMFGRKEKPRTLAKSIAPADLQDDQAHEFAPSFAPQHGEYEADMNDDLNLAAIENVLDGMGKGSDQRQKVVNIWDLEDDEPADVEPEPVKPRASSARARRNRTRLIGFEKSDVGTGDVFEAAEPTTAPTEKVLFPVGWIVVASGPGRGHTYALTPGMAQIGRAEDQAIQLDFGDNAISRNNHAAIVYDHESKSFFLGHGGKANIVRLNDKPVISNETIKDGDKIRIGETTLLLKTLVNDDFNWVDQDDDGEDENVAIA